MEERFQFGENIFCVTPSSNFRVAPCSCEHFRARRETVENSTETESRTPKLPIHSTMGHDPLRFSGPSSLPSGRTRGKEGTAVVVADRV
eukprot:scaffold80313_cov56-Attheya_sp.AAC.3